jgi:hypothetical protein
MTNNLVFLLLLLAAAATIAMILGAGRDVIYTNHAILSHADQAINASTIIAMIQAGTCTPTVYDCGRNMLALCPLQNGNLGGVFYAIENDKLIIITGFQGSRGFWERKTRGCRQME